MRKTLTTNVLAAVATAVVAFGCRDAVSPEPDAVDPPNALLGLNVGSIRVTNGTSGDNPDLDGYTVRVTGLLVDRTQSMPTGGSTTFSDLVVGSYSVQLGGIAANCSADANPRTVNVSLLTTTNTHFTVTCRATTPPPPPPPQTGHLTVTTRTTGNAGDLDQSYTIRIDRPNGPTRTIGPNQSTTFNDLPAGNHEVFLDDLAANCRLTSGLNPRTIGVLAGQTVTTTFDLDCAPPPTTTGNLTVTTATAGENLDPNGYQVTVTGPGGTTTRPFGNTETFTFTNLPQGQYTVTLNDVAANCMVTGGNQRTVNVPAGGTTPVDFAINCGAGGGGQPTTGELRITTATTGVDPDGYLIILDRRFTRSIGLNETQTFTGVTPGTYFVVLGGEASNCTVNGQNGRSVTVTAGMITNTTFSVTCTAATPPTGARISGVGVLGTGPAVPRSDRFEFDFQATDAPGGRIAITDYSIINPDGSVGAMTVDPATAPNTGVTAFNRISAACVRLRGVGLLRNGQLERFVLEACDNANPGAGADTFMLTLPDDLPDSPYVRSGTVREGDIVIQ